MVEPARDYLCQENYVELGNLMTRNHEITREIGGSGEVIESLISECLKHGAISAKLAGAGHGGTVIALVENADALEMKLRAQGYKTFTRPMIAPGLRQVT
jgi:galactokinase